MLQACRSCKLVSAMFAPVATFLRTPAQNRHILVVHLALTICAVALAHKWRGSTVCSPMRGLPAPILFLCTPAAGKSAFWMFYTWTESYPSTIQTLPPAPESRCTPIEGHERGPRPPHTATTGTGYSASAPIGLCTLPLPCGTRAAPAIQRMQRRCHTRHWHIPT